jgi:SAM-dependent MidA family methyltransferase
MLPLELPEPSPGEAEHSRQLASALCALISAEGGWIPFSRFMEFVLYAPALGYYASGSEKFGRQGDFVTAPELSGLFARCLARSLAPVVQATDGAVLELGAGSGALAAELIPALERQGARVRYLILETSAELRARQQQRLLGLPVEWLDALPARFAGALIANEVADALPVERFRITRHGPERLGVEYAEGSFRSAARAPSGSLAAEVAAFERSRRAPFPEGFVGEYAPLAAPWVAALAHALERGLVLLIDYGASRAELYADERAGGTLAACYRQRLHGDPYTRVGIQDLSAWVDFTRLADRAVDEGLEVATYTTQAEWLLSYGFAEELAALLAERGEAPGSETARAGARLVLPTGMGERYKCLALTKGVALRFPGRDYATRL